MEQQTKQEEMQQEQKKTSFLSDMAEVLETVFVSIFVVILLFAYVIRPVTVEGDSMRETLHNKDRLLMSDLLYTPKYGDIVIVNPILMKGAIIEIQGEVIHGSGAILDHDAERMTALQSMGFDVFLVTHDMLNDSKQLDTIVRSVCDRLGIRYKVKTEAMKCAETRLRANVLCNWLEIGN